MTNTYYLKTPSESDLISALNDLGLALLDREDNVLRYSNNEGISAHLIGSYSVATCTGECADGYPTYDYTSHTDFHCNIYTDQALPASLESFLVTPTPTTPYYKLA